MTLSCRVPQDQGGTDVNASMALAVPVQTDLGCNSHAYAATALLHDQQT